MTQKIDPIVDRVSEILLNHSQARDYTLLEEAGETTANLLNDYPEDPHLLFCYGTYLHYKGFHGAAIPVFDKVVRKIPNHFAVWSNLGVCWRLLHHTEKSRQCFLKSLRAQDDPLTHNNMAATYINEGTPDLGIPYAEKALSIDSNCHQARWNLSLLNLEKEDWKKGFEYYDAGFLTNERSLRNYADKPLPFWRGEEGTVALFDEQGLGDRILFMNMIRYLTPDYFPDNEFILEVHPRLEALYRRSFPWIKHIYATVKDENLSWPLEHKIDYRCAIASLPNLYFSMPELINPVFERVPYLIADEEKVKYYRDLYKQEGDGPYIGFSWFGGVRKTHGHQRSIKLGWMQDIIKAGGTWVSLQYNDWAADKIKRFNAEHRTNVIHVHDQADYDHMTAAIAACDHVITVCNTVAHTAGALGTSCWVMVPKTKAWRYPSGERFPWYGDHITMKHQKTTWEALLDQLEGDTRQWLLSQS